MSVLLRGHLLRAVSSASAGAIRLASIQGTQDDQAMQAVEDAIADLIDALTTAMECVGINDDEEQRKRLYRDLLDYRAIEPRHLGDASPQEAQQR